jgi:hypothetical protein
MVLKSDVSSQAQGPFPSKTMTSSYARINDADNLMDKRSLRNTLSPKNITSKHIKNHSQTLSPPNQIFTQVMPQTSF